MEIAPSAIDSEGLLFVWKKKKIRDFTQAKSTLKTNLPAYNNLNKRQLVFVS